MKKILSPENYYENCFSIMRMEDEPGEKIRIRAFYPEYNLIEEEVPLHENQQRLMESKDGMYRPNRDFLQELLWQGRYIILLQLESLRQKMIGILKDKTRSYETDKCTNRKQK